MRRGDGESAEDEVVQLDALGRDDVAQGEERLREEVGEVVEEDEDDALGAEVEGPGGVSELATAEEGRQETEERDELAVERRPALCAKRSGVSSALREVRLSPPMLTSLSFIIKSLGIKRRCEMRPTQEKVNPGKKRGWSVLSEWLWEAKELASRLRRLARVQTHLKATRIW